MRVIQWTAAAAIIVMLSAPAIAQSRGQGHLHGMVKDESGQPVEGVQVKAVMQGEKDVFTDRTNKKGEWAINGIKSGQWNLDFSKEGYETRSITVPFSELATLPPMAIDLKKAVVKVDPNAEIKSELQKAAPLLEGGKYAEARAIYEQIEQKYPDVWQVEPLIARTYAGENNPDAAMTHLQKALEHDPDNVEVKLLMASTLVDQKKTDEAQKYLDSIDMAKVKDPTVFLNEGISLINQGKAADALPLFDKVVMHYPGEAEAYYYRGRCELAVGKFPEAKADLQKFVAMPGADASQVDQAKKILEQLK
ncbi:MAG TPA: tetratricopeptide repeat protein [Vicinamibacterales bacterium]|nr:tetratricopeptide repeat protein [Vicinamibacterales bacterium]